MSKTVQLPKLAQVAAVVGELTPNQISAVKVQALALVNADKTFADAIKAVATGVARVLGEKPSFDHWTLVQTAFVKDYAAERKVQEETARQRWVKVADAMKAEFALEKPTKPTQAAEVKAKQRGDAATQAAALVANAKAVTPEAILKLSTSTDAPVSAPVIAALSKLAGEAAKEAGKAASEAAREESKNLRESIRKATQTLTLAQLRKVSAYIAKLGESTPAPAAVITPAAAAVGLPDQSDETEPAEETTTVQ